jgi:hypothetical protein
MRPGEGSVRKTSSTSQIVGQLNKNKETREVEVKGQKADNSES